MHQLAVTGYQQFSVDSAQLSVTKEQLGLRRFFLSMPSCACVSASVCMFVRLFGKIIIEIGVARVRHDVECCAHVGRGRYHDMILYFLIMSSFEWCLVFSSFPRRGFFDSSTFRFQHLSIHSFVCGMLVRQLSPCA